MNILRENIDTALALTAQEGVNASGGVAVWDLPPVAACAYNPIIFTRTLFKFAVGDYAPPQSVTPNYLTIDGTTVKAASKTATGLHVVLDTDAGSVTGYLESGRTEWYFSDKCTAINGVTSVGLTADAQGDWCADSSFIYVRAGYAYSDSDFLCSAAGVVLYKDTATIETAYLDIWRNSDSRDRLTGESYKGVVKFDAGAVVRLWHKPSLLVSSAEVFTDRALAVPYLIKGIGESGWSKTFLAVTAVAQVGESADMTGKAGQVLTRLPYMRLYDGYPLDYSVLAVEGDVETVRGTAKAYGVSRVLATGLEQTLQDSEGEDILAENDTSVTLIPAMDYKVLAGCVPANPFYVRWVNRLGGVDYWMFARQQRFAPAVKSSSLYEPYCDDPLTAGSNRRAYGITTERTVSVCAEGLKSGEWQAVSELPYSPLIEWYNESAGRWVTLAVSSFDGSFDSFDSVHRAEIVFSLPSINTQF